MYTERWILQNRVTTLEMEKSELKTKVEKLRLANMELEARIRNLKEQNQRLEGEKFDLEIENAQLRDSIVEMVRRLQEVVTWNEWDVPKRVDPDREEA